MRVFLKNAYGFIRDQQFEYRFVFTEVKMIEECLLYLENVF